MGLFDQLSQINIQHPKMTIRTYQETDGHLFTETFDASLLTWFIRDYKNAVDYINEKQRLVEQAKLVFLVFINPENNQLMGTSCIYDIQDINQAVEIGATWFCKSYQGTGHNPLSKYLLMRFLIKDLRLNRVQLKADSRNLKSIQAMKRIGLAYEGCLKKHMMVKNEFMRDTVFFSVTQAQWPYFEKCCLDRIHIKLGIQL